MALLGNSGTQVWFDEASEMELYQHLWTQEILRPRNLVSTTAAASHVNDAVKYVPLPKVATAATDMKIEHLVQTEVARAVQKFAEKMSELVARRDQRIDELSNRIVDLEQKIEFLIAVENNENFGKF